MVFTSHPVLYNHSHTGSTTNLKYLSALPGTPGRAFKRLPKAPHQLRWETNSQLSRAFASCLLPTSSSSARRRAVLAGQELSVCRLSVF